MGISHIRDSDFLYNHHLNGVTSLDTLEGKHKYKRITNTLSVNVKSYHVDNLRYNNNKITTDCKATEQTLTFCGVGTHHQNAVAKSRVKYLYYGDRTVLLHAKLKWPEIISINVWPYTTQTFIDRHNKLSVDDKGTSSSKKKPIPTIFRYLQIPTLGDVLYLSLTN